MKIYLIFSQALIYLFTLSNFVLSQAPNLGRASSFSIFTANGAFTNLGTSNITGDIGTDIGAFTGFPDGVLSGEIHVNDSISNLVALDVNSAYNSVLILTCDSVIGNTLGSNQILGPKTYCIGSAASLSGNLNLDAGGDPNAIFIFKIDGAFSSSTFSTITLLNNASSCNVYWQINGAVSLGANSSFVGTFLVNGAVELFESTTLQGKSLVTVGAISLHNNLVSFCGTVPVILPITLLSFEAKKQNNIKQVNLTWETASEENSAYFLLEKSTNGINFNFTTKLMAAGNSSEKLLYHFEDKNLILGTIYYRINQVDYDGVAHYSSIKSVDIFPSNLNVTVSPNPFLTAITIDMNKNKFDIDCQFSLYNALGLLITELKIEQIITTIETNNYPKGVYYYTITNQEGIFQTGKLISKQ